MVNPYELVKGKFYEVTYKAGSYLSDERVYLVEATSSEYVKVYWRDNKRYERTGKIFGAKKIREITELHAKHNIREPITNDEATRFLLKDEE